MQKKLSELIVLLLILSDVASAMPAIPNRFYGTVNFMDGPAPDGSIVEAKIDGTTVASATTFGGNYGYAPNIFDINDPNNNRNGNTIKFFINGADTGKIAIFTNGEASEVNLILSAYTNQKISNSAKNSPSGSSVGSAPQPTASDKSCSSSWYCTDWSSCSDNIQTRKCVDINYCTTPTGKPILSQECDKPETYEEKNDLAPLETTNMNSDSEPVNMPTGRFSSVTLNNAGVVVLILLLVAIIWQVRKK